jgi:hypothetical protein
VGEEHFARSFGVDGIGVVEKRRAEKTGKINDGPGEEE